MTDNYADLYWTFNAIYNDIERRNDLDPDKDLKSVVLCTGGDPAGMTPDEAKNDPDGKKFLPMLGWIKAYRVPIVMASGNFAETGRAIIDTIPQSLEGPDVPLIIVGAAKKLGERLPRSQGGPQLTIYAPREDVVAQSKINREIITEPGTSLGKLEFVLRYLEKIVSILT